ncbi:hypothetical protein ACWEKJ_38480, partial [Amycolatopsis thermoflava]
TPSGTASARSSSFQQGRRPHRSGVNRNLGRPNLGPAGGVRAPRAPLRTAHRDEEQQAKERELAGAEWHEGGWNGNPLDPRRDLDEWKALLAEARLHDARHIAATVLLILGVAERAVMEFRGWSNTAMAKRYQYITGGLRSDIAERLNGYLWSS